MLPVVGLEGFFVSGHHLLSSIHVELIAPPHLMQPYRVIEATRESTALRRGGQGLAAVLSQPVEDALRA